MSSLKLPAQHNVVPGRNYRTPKEVWGFALPSVAGRPADVARAALKANAKLLGLTGVLTSLHCRKVIRSMGAWHVVFSQRHAGLRVHRAYVTVHMNRRREAYLIKNRAVPRDLLPDDVRPVLNRREQRRLAVRSVARRSSRVRILDEEELVWFPLRKRLHPARKFRMHKVKPREEWIVYVDAVTGRILSKYDNLAAAEGTARVFNPNPVVALAGFEPLLENGNPVDPPESAYVTVRLRGLKRTGFLDGERVTTSLTRPRMRPRPDLRFEFQSNQRGFDEAMVYFHIDEAIRYLERLGYRGDRAIFRAPLEVNAHGTREDNSWYSPGLRTLTFGTGDVDDAEDGELILHEFGHAVQDAICPDFGQSQEAAAMGEGFGDYFAGSFFAQNKIEKRAGDLVPTVMTWDGILFEFDPEKPPPCVRRLDGGVTYESFDHSPSADEHTNGEIWSATLWDIRGRLRRRVADAIVVESHFQLDGFTTFARGARAMLDADRNLFHGRHVASLKRIFRKRGIGPVD